MELIRCDKCGGSEADYKIVVFYNTYHFCRKCNDELSKFFMELRSKARQILAGRIIENVD